MSSKALSIKLLGGILLSLQLCGIICAQPTAFTHTVYSLGFVEPVVPEPLDFQAVLLEDHQREQRGGPYRFAVARPVEVTPETEGMWEQIDDQTLLWRLPIESPGSLSISLGFTRFFLPSGGKVYIYSADESQVLGPFTKADNKEHRQLWTPLIYSDAIIVELTIPVSEVPDLELELTSINHGYRHFDSLSLFAVGDSNDCNRNVACEEGDPYRDQIRSVAWYHIAYGNSLYLCTGSLINNTAQDDKPYFLTAFHCFDGNRDRILDDPNEAAKTMVIYWNYQSSTCEGDTVSDSQNQSVASFRAGNWKSDFALVELESMPPRTAGVYYAGWDRSSAAPLSGTAIHHPQQDIKKISIENGPLYKTSTSVDYGDNNIVEYSEVFEVRGWDVGMTEKGSSGCPLFDPNNRVVAQLLSGVGTCETQLSSFGPLYRSWSEGVTRDTRLSAWLDPLNTDVMFLNGKNPDKIIMIGSGDGDWIHPMFGASDQRTQVIYLASEIGSSGIIKALALDVTEIPGFQGSANSRSGFLNEWTIRMKHTSSSEYDSDYFDNDGWTVVYMNDENVNSTGWRTFEFQTPFEYNGTDNLMVDFSHRDGNRGEFVFRSGACRGTNTHRNRSIIVRSDRSNPFALNWESGTRDFYVPDVKLTIRNEDLITYPIKLTPTDGKADDNFGTAVQISGDYAIVGAPIGNDHHSELSSVYVFKREANGWIQQDKLTAPVRVGRSVSISGHYAILGGGSTNTAYIFKRDGANWELQQRLIASDHAAGDYFGCSVSISGDYVIIGAAYDDDKGDDSGSAYIFRRSGATWQSLQKLTVLDGAANDLFGGEVAIDGDYAVVGAIDNDHNGSAYIFKLNEFGGWEEQDKLPASHAHDDDFGWAVSISGDYVIVGARLANVKGNRYSGCAYVYKRNGTSWTQQDMLIAADVGQYDLFGSSVSISGHHAIVGSYRDYDNPDGSGYAYLFKRGNTGWIPQRKLTAPDKALGEYGRDVSINGDYVIVGAPGDDANGSNSGSVYILKL